MGSEKFASGSDWEAFNPFFKHLEVPAKTVLIAEGQVSKTMFYIEKGCVRTWINSDEKDITTQFLFGGDRVSSIERFRTIQPSLYSIETIEHCSLQTLSQRDVQQT